MNRLEHKRTSSSQRKLRLKATVRGTSDRPRLNVHISRLNVSAQLIDDSTGKVIASASTIGKQSTGSLTDKAIVIGNEIAKLAKSAKVKKVVFDRSSKQYHGRVKALADAARQAGLEF